MGFFARFGHTGEVAPLKHSSGVEMIRRVIRPFLAGESLRLTNPYFFFLATHSFHLANALSRFASLNAKLIYDVLTKFWLPR